MRWGCRVQPLLTNHGWTAEQGSQLSPKPWKRLLLKRTTMAGWPLRDLRIRSLARLALN
jgi:hypothetical protein